MQANGNNVDLENEMNELAKNNIAYQGMVQKLSMQFNMLEHVISDGER
jgi:flagellar basal-body rod protein FlgB